MEEGAQLELPVWLAELLAVTSITLNSQRAFVSLNRPAIFSQKVINALKSDPLNVDLNTQSTVFTWMMERWLALFGDKALGQVAVETINRRSAEIYDFALTHKGLAGENSDFLLKLDTYEKQCK